MFLYLEVSKIWVLRPVTYIATDRNFLTTDFSDQNLSLSVIVVFVNFSHFYLLQNHWDNFNQIGTMHYWVKKIQACSNKRPRFFLMGVNFELLRSCWYFLNNRLPKTIWLVKLKPVLNQSQFVKIQVQSIDVRMFRKKNLSNFLMEI